MVLECAAIPPDMDCFVDSENLDIEDWPLAREVEERCKGEEVVQYM